MLKTNGIKQENTPEQMCLMKWYENLPEEKIEVIAKLQIKPELFCDETYVGLMRYQRADLAKLTERMEYHNDNEQPIDNENFSPTIVLNYRKLIRELFQKEAKLEWRNKNIAAIQNKKLIKERQTDELAQYLTELLGQVLYGDAREAVQQKLSFYFGCSKKGAISSVSTINKSIAEYGYKFDTNKKSIDKKKTVCWELQQI